MNTDSQCRVIARTTPFVMVLLVIVMLFPFSAFADPSGYMGRHMMSDEDREKLMEEGGYPYGPGYGWMGGMGGGPGWMGGMMGGFYGLELTSDQRDKIRDIQRSMRKKNIGIMEKVMERSSRLEELYDADKLDAHKIGKAYDELYEVKREMILQHIEARNRMYEVLNKEQREKFKSRGYYGHMGGMMMY